MFEVVNWIRPCPNLCSYCYPPVVTFDVVNARLESKISCPLNSEFASIRRPCLSCSWGQATSKSGCWRLWAPRECSQRLFLHTTCLQYTPSAVLTFDRLLLTPHSCSFRTGLPAERAHWGSFQIVLVSVCSRLVFRGDPYHTIPACLIPQAVDHLASCLCSHLAGMYQTKSEVCFSFQILKHAAGCCWLPH